MVWLSAVLLLGALALTGAAGLRLLKLERGVMDSADGLRRDGLLMLEVQRLHLRQSRLAAAQRLTETTIDAGADVARAVHQGIAAIPFGVLEAVPVARDVSRVVRRTHDLIADAVYGSIKGVNKAVGGAARGVLKPPRERNPET